jgi:ABC-type bacteriocin/lantibiotic exporter with double-glycine peptidase domain
MQDFSMRIRRGTMTELRWPSGSGKTTLLRMLAGLLTPERGVISVDRMDPAHAREHVLYLPQDAHLFSGSVLENLRLLSGGASRERIARAAATTGLAATVATWPMGFETLVSSRGANVSGGQRQLILLTAAVASDRPILLLDESLANVDRIQRVMIQDAKMFEGRTVLSVVHDGVRELKDVPPDA